MTREQTAWSQRGFHDARRGVKYNAALAGRQGGETAELAYAQGFRVGRRERLREQRNGAAA